MIRYDGATYANVCAEVDVEDPKWRGHAKTRTAAIKSAGTYSEGPPSWSDIKAAFMRLQFNKCAFCEFPLGGEHAGKATQDIEHFRPKNAVRSWPRTTGAPKAAVYPFPTGGAGPGYYWLAFEVGNYAASCKACNTARKSNYFPVAASRESATLDVAGLNANEKPFLIFPLGTVDDDPETLIVFEGVIAKPAHLPDSHEYRRGRVTIDFFALNDREELWEDRFRVIHSLFNAVEVTKSSTNQHVVDSANRRIADMTSPSGASAACARAYLRLLRKDGPTAWRYYLEAEAFVDDKRLKRKPRGASAATAPSSAFTPPSSAARHPPAARRR